ncbi:MAG: N-acetyltransferase [Spirochaetales bacterium]|jgi:hypothetical protein|nr:N-acetyltransferase [Spirochaetales bacterium]
MPAGNNNISVVPVDLQNKKQVKTFIKFHYKIYRDDPNWVAPLIIDYLERLSPKKNPYLHHSHIQLFLAYKNGELAGRISAHENNNHVKFHNEKVGFFGFFECINDQEVADALFSASAEWLAGRGLEIMRGPASFSVNGDPVGMLTDAFTMRPILGMSYNPDYYPELVEKASFVKVQDLNAFHYTLKEEGPERFKKIAERALRDPKLVIRTPDIKNIKKEIESLKFIYNEALAKNWGAVPMTDEEFDHFSSELKLAVDPDITYIAEYDGKPVGLSMVFKDMNQALKPAKGRLFPFGLLKILRMRKKISWVRVPVLGVLEEYRTRGIDVAFYVKSMEAAYEKGYREAEMSFILESNKMMSRILLHLGFTIYKTYRVYDRDIIS